MNKKTDIEILIESEIEKTILEEGLADWLKRGVQAASGAWEGIKDKLTQSSNGLKNSLLQKLAQIKQVYPQALQQYNDLKAIEKEAGVQMPVNNVIKMAMELPAAGQEAMAEVKAEYETVKNAAKNVATQNTRQPAQQQAQEAYAIYTSTLLEETQSRYLSERALLKEVDPFGAAGLVLGVIGGVPLLLKGLYKFASFLKLGKTAEFFKKVYTVAHHAEEKAIDYIVPDKLSYLYYVKKYNMTRGSGQPPALPFEQYVKSDVRKKVEKQMYTIMLIPFLLHGISAVAQAGATLIGAAEGAATTVKAVEIGQQILAVANQVSKV